VIVSVVGLPCTAEDPPPTTTPAALDDAARERFLLEARIVSAKDAGGGSTPSKRATLRLDGLEHDAHIQTIDKMEPVLNLADGPPELDFRDSYKNNVAAYRLDRLLGLGMVPVTVVRLYQRKKASFTWWVDDVQMNERERAKEGIQPPNLTRWDREIFVVRVFDELIYNTDRNPGNLLIDDHWRVWMIDHSRAFKIFKTLECESGPGACEERLGTRCARQLLAGMRGLDEPTLHKEMEDLLSPGQIEGLLARRDRIVAHYDAKIAEIGVEAAVLYDLPPRDGLEPPRP
jgi:hypothetical protein